MFSRFARYFDEVARSGSLRRASDRLHIAPSAIDRQILNMEEQLGLPLFERLPQGLRLTAAGEILVDGVRRWRRDYMRVKAQIDELKGLRRGEVSIALAEGSVDFVTRSLKSFQDSYPAIAYRLLVHGSDAIVDLVRSGEVEIGLTFNPPAIHALRVEGTLIYQIGAVVPAGHPLADAEEVDLIECAQHRLIIPDDSISMRTIFDQTWAKTVGGIESPAITANSLSLMKKLVVEGMGVGIMTQIDISDELRSGVLKYVPLNRSGIPLSVLTLISEAGRTLPVPSLLLSQHLARLMEQEAGPAN